MSHQYQALERGAVSGLVSREFTFRGETFIACHSGALYWPEHDALLVADLHLEKGSAFARSGQFIPPYDSEATLAQLEQDIVHFRPSKVMCLGDSFHDVNGPDRLGANTSDRLQTLTALQDFTWILGNHDPSLPVTLGGMVGIKVSLTGKANRVILCHEPGGAEPQDGLSEPQEGVPEGRLELCGHLHPVATIHTRGRSLRRRCFVLSGGRIILPAYGAYTGGLNVRDDAFAPYVQEDMQLLVIGRQSLSMHEGSSLIRHRRAGVASRRFSFS